MKYTPKTKAKKVAKYFLRGDDYIDQHNHRFDDLWEDGDGDEVAKQFRILYDDSISLKKQCDLSSFFCLAMVGK